MKAVASLSAAYILQVEEDAVGHRPAAGQPCRLADTPCAHGVIELNGGAGPGAGQAEAPFAGSEQFDVFRHRSSSGRFGRRHPKSQTLAPRGDLRQARRRKIVIGIAEFRQAGRIAGRIGPALAAGHRHHEGALADARRYH